MPLVPDFLKPPNCQSTIFFFHILGSSTEKLEELRPVTFTYKREPGGARQFGLIAEEVARVYPELVIRDAKGGSLSVRYDELAPMLLDVAQKQATRLRSQDERISELEQQIKRLETFEAEVTAMKATLTSR
jgi:hypothetical protein